MTSAARGEPATRVAGRRRILARRRVDFWLDVTILVGFTLAYSFGFTGPAFTKAPSGRGPGGRVAVIRPGAKLPPGAHADILRIKAGGGGGAGFDPAGPENLIRTAEIEAAVVVVLDLIRRRYRRAKRARQFAART